MIPKVHPAVFLGAAILVCAAWLWVRPPVSAIEIVARSQPRPAVVERKTIELGQPLLERYVGQYEGRGGFVVELTLKDGKLLAQSVGAMPSIPFELRATSETEFFLLAPGSMNPPNVDLEFDVARDGTVRGFVATTEFGLVEVKRVR